MTDLINVLLKEKDRAEQSLEALTKYWQDVPGFTGQNEHLIWKLARINAAIERFEDGKLGICLSCDQPIAEKRLEKFPYVEYCFNCQNDVEYLIHEFERASLIPRE